MLNVHLHNSVDAGGEPAPSFASEAEIKLAEQLRRQIEERYLGAAADASSPPPRADQNH